MKIISKITRITTILTLTIGMYSCSDDDDGNVVVAPTQSIAEFVASQSNYSSLKAALDLTELTPILSGTEQFTVFAPDNGAFTSFLTDAGFADLSEVDTDEEIALVKSILLNHVVNGSNLSATLSTGYINTQATYGDTVDQFLSMYLTVENNTVTINGGSSGENTGAVVSQADIITTNGVIHAVDAVIQLPKVTTFATADPNFSRLVEGLTAYSFEYVTTLEGAGPFTVLAPDNAAFDTLLDSNADWNATSDIPEATLETALNLHVISGSNVREGDLTDGEVTTLGGNIAVDTTNNTITDGSDPAISSTIVSTNVQATNGVIHVIDTVLLSAISNR
ncbi:fasciclin domain-containing protein [Aquimarina sp. RZ0]|uniref:fasciclin domain-containing protein n=1 Tax=Aquimarina sp. RZ0 TaxID=2607730 RepID=UPI0011F2CC2A|nr:fasciclin domain-containing protein [Aquimarina sp. RZ0]KAA1247831.1 fasciclin domain-containing protein [Aquimarina sp. RZ0]